MLEDLCHRDSGYTVVLQLAGLPCGSLADGFLSYVSRYSIRNGSRLVPLWCRFHGNFRLLAPLPSSEDDLRDCD